MVPTRGSGGYRIRPAGPRGPPLRVRACGPRPVAVTPSAPAAREAATAPRRVAPVVHTSSTSEHGTPRSGQGVVARAVEAAAAVEPRLGTAGPAAQQTRGPGRPSLRARARASSSDWSKPRARRRPGAVGTQVTTAGGRRRPAATAARPAASGVTRRRPSLELERLDDAGPVALVREQRRHRPHVADAGGGRRHRATPARGAQRSPSRRTPRIPDAGAPRPDPTDRPTDRDHGCPAARALRSTLGMM